MSKSKGVLGARGYLARTYEPSMLACRICHRKIITGKYRLLRRADHVYCSKEHAALGAHKTVWPPSSVLAAFVRYMPVEEIARHLQVSGVAVKKRLKKRGIEVPGRGYWAKVAGAKLRGEKPPPWRGQHGVSSQQADTDPLPPR
jgi:hypothetical protein